MTHEILSIGLIIFPTRRINMLRRYFKNIYLKLEKRLLASIRSIIKEEVQCLKQSQDIREQIQVCLKDERKATHWIIRKELVSERRPIHWIVRNELQKSKHNLFFRELSEAAEDSLRYARQFFGNAHAFQDKFALRKYLLNAYKSDGIVLEFGVYQGSSITQIACLLPDNQVYGFDSFEGLPEDWRSGFNQGHFRVANTPEVPANVELVKGLFENSLPKFLEQHKEEIGMVHIDCDLYSSTNLVLKSLESRLKKGVILLFDEYYNYPGWRNGEFAAFQEFIGASDRSYEYIAYNSSQCQVAVKLV